MDGQTDGQMYAQISPVFYRTSSWGRCPKRDIMLFGQRTRRGRSPVKHRGNLWVHTSIRQSVFLSPPGPQKPAKPFQRLDQAPQSLDPGLTEPGSGLRVWLRPHRAWLRSHRAWPRFHRAWPKSHRAWPGLTEEMSRVPLTTSCL